MDVHGRSWVTSSMQDFGIVAWKLGSDLTCLSVASALLGEVCRLFNISRI